MKNNVLLGFSEVDITPASSVQTIGFNRKDNMSKGVLHKLFAQISVWHSKEEKCCLVAIDHIGFSCHEADLLRDLIGNKLGITRDKIMLCFSHTHSAPNVSIEPEYFSFLCSQVILGVGEAESNLEPIKAAWGMVEANIGINRRDENGILDRRVAVLKIAHAEDSNLRLLILRVTAHANVLLRDNYLISSDFIGVTRNLLEEKYGCKVMITQGASGNVKPKYSGSLKSLDKMAIEIKNSIDKCIENLKPQTIKNLSMFSQKESFFADVPTLEQAKKISAEAMNENNIDGSNWLKEVNRLHSEGIKQQSKDIEIQYLKLNEGCLCGVANEIMCEIAVDVAKTCNNELIYLGGYTNGCDGYLPTAEEYSKGGYEVLHSYLIYYIYHGTVMPLNPDTARKLVKLISKQL
ncbi:hypothetical protein SDC9_105611 [bioreactor metagenome]|uniref:Neutral/alkaline non-lysosomal ceramidase N-terminal domain-containing protein n=1 Tax=bioreactor metagenome TaxID=1076179 RepID=A0A645B160_9ZZZZ